MSNRHLGAPVPHSPVVLPSLRNLFSPVLWPKDGKAAPALDNRSSDYAQKAPPAARGGQDKAHITHFCRRPSQSSINTWGRCERSLRSPNSSWENSRVKTPSLPCLNILRRPGTHKKKENPRRREILGRMRWKGGKYSHNKALAAATAHFSHALSDGFNKGAHTTLRRPTQFLRIQMD